MLLLSILRTQNRPPPRPSNYAAQSRITRRLSPPDALPSPKRGLQDDFRKRMGTNISHVNFNVYLKSASFHSRTC